MEAGKGGEVEFGSFVGLALWAAGRIVAAACTVGVGGFPRRRTARHIGVGVAV